MIEKDKNIDNLKELELQLVRDATTKRKALLKEQEIAIQDAEDLRIKNKRINQSIIATKEDQAYQVELEAFEGAILDLIGDLNDMLLLVSKGKLGRNLIPGFNSLYLKIGNYKKSYSNKLVNVKAEDRTHLYTLNKRLDSNIKTVLIPILTKDRNKQERLKNRL